MAWSYLFLRENRKCIKAWFMITIDKPEAKSQSQSNPKREMGIWSLGLSLKSHVLHSQLLRLFKCVFDYGGLPHVLLHAIHLDLGHLPDTQGWVGWLVVAYKILERAQSTTSPFPLWIWLFGVWGLDFGLGLGLSLINAIQTTLNQINLSHITLRCITIGSRYIITVLLVRKQDALVILEEEAI